MQVEAKGFFMIVAALAAGGVGGYVASEKHVFSSPKADPTAPPAIADSAKPSVSVVAAAASAPLAPPPLPACDDAVGTAGDCPGIGMPTEEGGCGGYANKRCNEYKQAMKPRVADNAVKCLAKLTPQEQCDPKRVDLCGHVALQNACVEPDMVSYVGWDAGAPPAGGVTTTCTTLVAACATATVPLSLVDCQRTLAGLNPKGREQMQACMQKHCADKG
ncbi:MAG: hypothetical protein ABI175_04280, partial [Polyangiales bacterium]